ncbi:hypothetical protein MUK42_15299 [Musa troglodytarum]|uniref:Uncharacterized protein n=1 Tax=Musa troglodytarum TaxID=320322 RepID=A0A9E7HVX2_9LILI|nr:hypothetical protein MUK42_15299 [Musa troglodytarum]
MKVDSKECRSATEADLPIAKKGRTCETTDSSAMGMTAPRYRRGGISVESSIPCSHGGRALGREIGRGETGELHKTGINGFLIKIAVSEGLRVDARVHDQGMKQAVCSVVPLLLRGVDDRNDGEGGTIPKAIERLGEARPGPSASLYFQVLRDRRRFRGG